MNKLIFKTESKPFIELYHEYIVIREKEGLGNDTFLKTYKEISNVIFVKKEKLTWWLVIFTIVFSVLGSRYESPEIEAAKLMIYLKDDLGNQGERFIFQLHNKRKEIDNVTKVLMSKLPKGCFKTIN